MTIIEAFKADVHDLMLTHGNSWLCFDRLTNEWVPGNVRFVIQKINGRNKRKIKLNPVRVWVAQILWRKRIFEQQKIAALFGVSNGTMSVAINGKTWA